MLRHQSLARFVAVPESRAALLAVRDVIDCLGGTKPRHAANPLMIHGLPGTGKSHLVSALAQEIIRGNAGATVHYLSAAEFREPAQPVKTNAAAHEASPAEIPPGLDGDACRHDLWVLEDLQHLPLRATERLVQILDDRLAREQITVLTATAGPRNLGYRGSCFPARLSSRLASGLVVGLEPWQKPSRLMLLDELCQRRQLAVPRAILEWLAEHLTGGGRQLEGAISQLEALSKLGHRLELAGVAAHFGPQVDAARPTVERITARVGSYYGIEPRRLQSTRRQHSALLPRQVSMYLTRQLTKLSLERIGAYFGGRDHTTVMHSCRKVERTLQRDAVLAAAVRQIQGELT